MKIEVERGVITFSSLCIENTTPIFCTEIVAVLQLGNNHIINKDRKLLAPVVYFIELA